ncbi:transposase [Paenibacillus baekrokdamisoli]|uniref:Transposase n=2 Tax=Paenibacillus baekrokdamisoli TaxID=1712516 RepID=A0A3G9J1H9_9BACL|nr:transposase [Paenibacillus baekrokdamisoli]
MKGLAIQSVIRKKRKQSNYTPSVVFPNRLKRKFHATAPQQKMVTDITYISDGTNFHYLSVIQDLFNNEIVAWQLYERNDVQLVLDTVEQWTRKRDVSEAVLHSDQGIQCNSETEIRQAVEEYIYYYNYHRFQAKLTQRAPIEYRCALAA